LEGIGTVNRRIAGFTCTLIAAISVVPAVVARSDEFEVASIRRSTTNIGPWSTQHPADGRFSGQNLSARRLILQAFDIEATEFQLTGGPGWIDSETYDLNAKSDVSGVIGTARLQVLLLSLLTSRFHLEYHRGSRILPLYALVSANNGRKLQKAAKPEGRQIENWGKDHLNALNVPVAEFARVLQSRVGRTVTDEIGIQGAFHLTWTPDSAETGDIPIDKSGQSIFTALWEQYGLKLESRKGPVEIIVIDRIERPTENRSE
jgi:uncharacterized protein (TIGR03435 family)